MASLLACPASFVVLASRRFKPAQPRSGRCHGANSDGCWGQHLPRGSFSTAFLASSSSPQGGKDAESSPKAAGKALEDEVEEATRKWGLEAGLWKALSRKVPEADGNASVSVEDGDREGAAGAPVGRRSNADVAKELLTKYGAAYLATSISLALVSFSFFYVLVDRGVDVPSLLSQLGLEVDGTGTTVGTAAIAYAAHKAASPIRFPPTVLLTPFVASLFGRGKAGDESGDE